MPVRPDMIAIGESPPSTKIGCSADAWSICMPALVTIRTPSVKRASAHKNKI